MYLMGNSWEAVIQAETQSPDREAKAGGVSKTWDRRKEFISVDVKELRKDFYRDRQANGVIRILKAAFSCQSVVMTKRCLHYNC